MANLRKAADRFCKSCLYDEREPGGWREQVGACTSAACPLVRATTAPCE